MLLNFFQSEEVSTVKSKSRKRPKNTPFNKLSKRNKKKKQLPKLPLEPPPYTETIESSTIEPITCTNDLPQNIGCDVSSLYSSVTNPDIYLHPGMILKMLNKNFKIFIYNCNKYKY